MPKDRDIILSETGKPSDEVLKQMLRNGDVHPSTFGTIDHRILKQAGINPLFLLWKPKPNVKKVQPLFKIPEPKTPEPRLR